MNDHEAERIADAMNRLRPDWPVKQLRTLLRDDRISGRPRRDIAVALSWIACENGTSTPYRVLETGPWWIATAVDGQTTGRREPFDPMRFCGTCNKPNDSRHPDDHAFESVLAERRKDEPDRALVSTRIQSMREHIGDSKALKDEAPAKSPLPSLPEVDRLRAELPTAELPTTTHTREHDPHEPEEAAK